MRRATLFVVGMGVGLLVAVGAGVGAHFLDPILRGSAWTSEFTVDKQDLVPTGRNPYFVLEPGHYVVLEGGGEQVTITVLNETKIVDGVETRVVEERELKNGKPKELSMNYFAISKRTNDVYYFGEDVNDFKDGKVVAHSGAWLSGVNGAKFGMMMPGQPLLNARYYQEIAPKVALDQAENVGINETLRTPAGEFKNVLKVKETNPLEPFKFEYKYYAPGIGLIQDGSMKLVKYGKSDLSKR